jgi:hypothetical protein
MPFDYKDFLSPRETLRVRLFVENEWADAKDPAKDRYLVGNFEAHRIDMKTGGIDLTTSRADLEGLAKRLPRLPLRAVVLHVKSSEGITTVPLKVTNVVVDNDGAHASIHQEDLPKVMQFTPPTPPEHQIVGAVNAGPWLALSQWIDCLGEQPEPDARLIWGLAMLLNRHKHPALDSETGRYYWASGRWMDCDVIAGRAAASRRGNSHSSISTVADEDTSLAHLLPDAVCRHFTDVEMLDREVTWSLPTYKDIAEAYRAAAYAWCDHTQGELKEA